MESCASFMRMNEKLLLVLREVLQAGLSVKSVSFEFLAFTFSWQSEENNQLNTKLETGRLKKSSKILGIPPTKTFDFT